MTESIEATLSAYLAGATSRDEARASLVVALAEGQRLERDLGTLPSAQRADVAALFGEAASDLLRIPPSIVTGSARRRWPPFGYMLIAGLLASDLVNLLISMVVRFRQWGDLSLIAGPWPVQVLWALVTMAEGVVVWAVWTQRRAAPEIYAAWGGAVLGGTVYRLALIGALAVRMVWVFNLGAPTLVLGLGYWYLAQHRVPAV